MKSAVLCIDYKTDKEQAWQKDWKSLCDNVEVITWGCLESRSKIEQRMVLVHSSALNNLRGVDDPRVEEIRQKCDGCIAIVSGGNWSQTVVSDDGRVCRLATTLGSGRVNLGNKSAKFAGLMQGLEQATNAEERRQAWLEFDSRPAVGYTVSLFILCQGWLAAWALQNQDVQGDIPCDVIEVAKALASMGWAEINDATQQLRVRPEISALGLVANDVDTAGTTFWTAPLGMDSRPGPGNALAERLNVEIGNEWPGGLRELVDAIQNQGRLDAATVAKAYNALSQKIEAMGC